MRLGIDGWSTWGIFLVTGSLQGSLLILGVYFRLRQPKSGMSHDNGISQIVPSHRMCDAAIDRELPESDITTPLLGGNQKNNIKTL